MTGIVEIADVRADEQLDWQKLSAYLLANLQSELPALIGQSTSDMLVFQFPGGSANLTYLVRFAETELVIRRPPLGKIAPGAHDMGREYRVLSRLYQNYPRAPRCYHLCEDESVIGAKFIVTERRTGIVVRDHFPDEMLKHENLAMRTSRAVVEAMAELHNVNPAQVGLEKLGKPDGFAQRQISGWNDRWQLAKHQEVPEFDALFELLNSSIPEAQRVSILHNDLKLDNCQLQAHNPDVVTSVFDWDMATLGDPLFDLGTLLNYWPDEKDAEPRKQHATGPVDRYPGRAQVSQWYAESTGLNIDQVNWYEAFALWKTAVVLQQIYIRYRRGQTRDERFAQIHLRIPVLLSQARLLFE